MKVELEIECQSPYALRYHLEGESARRGFWLQQRAVVVDLRQEAADRPVRATVVSDRADLPEDAVEQALRHMLAADDSLEAIGATLRRDKRMARLLEALPGLKPLRVPDLWTTLLRSIISQQISTAAARAIREKISRRFGQVLEIADEQVSIVPAPQAVLAMSDTDFAEVGFSRRKAEYARGIAEAFHTGRIDAAALMRGSPEHLIETLSALRGVGVWTAECVGIFCIGHPDLLPADDLGIQQSVGALYKLPHVPKPKEVTKIGQKWAGWRSYASIYLWGARNHDVLPKVRLMAAPKEKRAALPKKATRSNVKSAKLPPKRTGAKQHTPVAPGRRGR